MSRFINYGLSSDSFHLHQKKKKKLRLYVFSRYLGQELYIRAINPDDTEHKTELPIPENVLFCGELSDKQKYVI